MDPFRVFGTDDFHGTKLVRMVGTKSWCGNRIWSNWLVAPTSHFSGLCLPVMCHGLSVYVMAMSWNILGKVSNLTNSFQMGWNHQLVVIYVQPFTPFSFLHSGTPRGNQPLWFSHGGFSPSWNPGWEEASGIGREAQFGNDVARRRMSQWYTVGSSFCV